ncbi:MAG: hypothetical protein EA353_06305 [Puniceicoccaceae bacterium]|nr:MAG: hypothetical protein EA353_06305 [Puniceicoccaceae bacterium]
MPQNIVPRLTRMRFQVDRTKIHSNIMERDIVKENIFSSLESTIKGAMALIDPKGTNGEISQAMNIVSIAFGQVATGNHMSSKSLYEEASRINKLECDTLESAKNYEQSNRQNFP